MRKLKKILLRISLDCGVLFLLGLLAWTLAPYFIPDPMQEIARQTPVRRYLDDNGNTVRLERTFDYQWRFEVPLDKVSPNFITAILAAEDRDFYDHGAISYRAILRAARSNFNCGRVVSGASTISMQLAALPWSGKRKTLKMKLLQIIRARRLEQFYDKNRILEEYVNRIPFGGKIYGIEAASIYYFGKSACDLNLEEATLLAGLPQRPNFFRPDRHLPRARKRQKMVLEAMCKCGDLKPEQIETINTRHLYLRDFTGKSSLANMTNNDYDMFLRQAKRECGDSSLCRTSLNVYLQNNIKNVLKQTCAQCIGVRDAAAVLLDVKRGCILALVGTLDFYEPWAGQVNAATARRSAGSTLKPFIYGEAIDAGYITMDTVLKDMPVTYGNYSPVNYDGTFRGKVSAEEALSLSLNTPAIALLAKLGVERVSQKFLQLGMRHPQGTISMHYGLPLALGTAGQTLLELTGAYTVFANEGIYRKPSFLADARLPEGTRLFSEGSAFMTAKMLRKYQLPGCTIDVAWKTGTSNGLRDAWCLAFTQDYVLGVWFGNKDGTASSNLVGSKVAAPAAGKIMSILYAHKNEPVWPEPWERLRSVELCSKSGLTPNASCDKTFEGFAMKGFQMRKCQICGNASAEPLNIISPKASIYKAKDALGVDIPLQANVNDAYWYIDGHYAGKPQQGEICSFTSGRHVIQVIKDEDFAKVTFTVE